MSSDGSFTKAAIPYAEALFESSKSMHLIKQTRDDLSIISATIENSKSLYGLLVNPVIGITAKKNILSNIFLDQIGTHVLNFLFILVERRRIYLFKSIRNGYINLVNNLELVLLVTIYTVIPLNNEQKDVLQSKLRMMTNYKVIQLITEIKPDLIGGVVIQIGSKIIDMSIYGQLNQVSSYLTGAYL